MLPVQAETQLAHLDKSHVTVHTYPEYHPETCHCYLPGGYRRGDLRGDHAAFDTRLPDWFV